MDKITIGDLYKFRKLQGNKIEAIKLVNVAAKIDKRAGFGIKGLFKKKMKF